MDSQRRSNGIVIVGMVLAGLGLPEAAAQAPSFDCRKASTVVEHAICDDVPLSYLDEALARALRDALITTPDRKALVSDQRRWLVARDKQCLAANPPAGKALAKCLSDVYFKRIAQLRESIKSNATPLAHASCEKIIERYRPLAEKKPGESPLITLSSAAAGISFEPNLLHMMQPEDVVEWGRKQTPPIAIAEALAAADQPYYGAFEKLPNQNFYSVTYTQGTGECLTAKYFTVENGRAIEAGTPPGFDGEGGESCLARRSFGLIDGTPVFFQEQYDFTPRMSSKVVVATWDAGRFVGACAIDFTYAPLFTEHVAEKESCSAADCKGLRAVAIKLAEDVQRNPIEALERRRASLTPPQLAEYEAALKAATQANSFEAASPQEDPAEITDQSPLRLPYVHQGHLHIVSLGHFSYGWRIRAAWSAKVDTFESGKLVPQAEFAIDMVRGRLKDVAMTVPE